MDIQAVEKLANLVAQSTLYEVSIHEGQESIRVKNASISKPITLGQNDNSANLVTARNPPNLIMKKKNLICSTHIGWLRLAQDTLATPLVKVGDTVNVGQILAYVGVLGKLEPVISDKAGTIQAVLAENEQMVEYGTPLFELEG